MNKKYFIFATFILLSISLAYAWDDCPKGFTDENCQVMCGTYTDTNKDSICDHSQENPSLTSQNIQNQQVSNQSSLIQSANKSKYNLIPIFAVTLILYLITYFLSKKEKISFILHKKIWNILLLATFLFTAVTSLLYIIKVDYSINSFNLASVSFWHIEIGIVMILISIFHALWHIPYFKSYIKTKSKE
ncbi:MAG TPA: hypothetical protein P5277_01920 [Candidatus Paceibacterota bacterium]|nr:hypothetical protein [Candidatus Paceibacterota bacterium]